MTFRMKTIPYFTGCTTKIQQNFDITKGQGTGKFYSLQQIFFISRSFDYYWGRENRLLYRGLRYIEVCYHSRFELVTSSFDIMQIKKLQYFMFIMKINFTIYMVYHVETSIFENFQILHCSKYGTFDICLAKITIKAVFQRYF